MQYTHPNANHSFSQDALETLAAYFKSKGVKPLSASFAASLAKWAPHAPHAKQQEFLNAPEIEVLFGGAAGGGKSDALLMAHCPYLDTPGYAGIIIRRTFSALTQPDALIPRARQWWNGRAHYNNESHEWTFPSGAVVKFGYLATDDDVYQYQSAAFQQISFDELTQFSEFQYTYMFSRLRRLADSDVPLKMRSATNPDGVGQDWVKQRFIDVSPADAINQSRAYIPSRLEDNPSLDQEAYDASLQYLDPLTKARLRNGDWEVSSGAAFPDFKPVQWHVIPTQIVPDHWLRRGAHDWGFASPGHHVWGAIVPPDPNGTDMPGPGLVIYREWGFDHLEADAIADTVKQLQQFERVPITVAGMDIFQEHRARLTVGQMTALANQGQLQLSIYDQYVRRGLICQPAITARVAGRQAIHSALRPTNTGVPWLRIMDCCPILIRSLKSIQVDPHNTEDVITDYSPTAKLRDDAYDALRYLIMLITRPNERNAIPAGYIPAYNPVLTTQGIPQQVFDTKRWTW